MKLNETYEVYGKQYQIKEGHNKADNAKYDVCEYDNDFCMWRGIKSTSTIEEAEKYIKSMEEATKTKRETKKVTANNHIYKYICHECGTKLKYNSKCYICGESDMIEKIYKQ